MQISNLKESRLLEWATLMGLLLLALYLRIGGSGVVEFKRDEANLSLLALDVANGENLPLLGIGSSVGFPNAPANVYVLAFPYVFTSNPEFATQFIGFLNVVAIVVTYLLVRRYTNPVIALIVVAIYTVSPWSLIFSRKIWAQNMLPIFVMATLFAGIAGFIENRRWGQLLCLPLATITGQIHYVAFVIVPALLFLIWHGRKRLLRPFCLSIIIAIALTMPFVIGLERADLLNPTTFREAMDSEETPFEPTDSGLFTFEALRSTAVLIAGTELHSLAGSERFMDYLNQVPDVYPLWGILAWLVLISALWLLFRAVRYADTRTSIDITLLIALGFPILAFSVNWTAFFIHYLIPIIPIAFVILGFGLYDFFAYLQKYRLLRSIAMGLPFVVLVLILGTQVWLWRDLLQFVDENATPNGFGTPYHYLSEPRQAILDQSPEQVIGQFDGQFIGFDGEATIWDALLYDVPIVRFEDSLTQVYPQTSAVMISNSCESPVSDEIYRLRENEGCYALSTRSQSDLVLSEFIELDIEPSTSFSNGVQVTHYLWNSVNGCLSLVWEIHQTATQDYMFAVHFFDDLGERIAQADGLSWAGRYWLPGDIVVRILCLPENRPDVTSVGIGMYIYDGTNFYGVDLVDSNNVSVGQMFSLPLE